MTPFDMRPWEAQAVATALTFLSDDADADANPLAHEACNGLADLAGRGQVDDPGLRRTLRAAAVRWIGRGELVEFTLRGLPTVPMRGVVLDYDEEALRIDLGHREHAGMLDTLRTIERVDA